MNVEGLLLSADFLQSSIILIYFSAYLTQWIEIYREQSSKNISLYSWMLYLVASIFALFYATVNHLAYHNSFALLCTTTFSLACNLFTIFLVLKFSERPEHLVSLTLHHAEVESLLDRCEVGHLAQEEARDFIAF
jgi:uncharacterized protein with PQ loop repeat